MFKDVTVIYNIMRKRRIKTYATVSLHAMKRLLALKGYLDGKIGKEVITILFTERQKYGGD